MERAAHVIVRQRRNILIILLILAAVSGIVSLRVPINSDMTQYLPADSRMKQGIVIMEKEFSDLVIPSTIRVMMEDLPEDQEEAVLEQLKHLEYAASASKTKRAEKAGKTYTLFTLSTDYDYRTEEALALEHGIPGAFPEYKVTVVNDDTNGMEVPFFIFVVALIILLLVLFVLSSSYLEPALFLFTIGAAILLNMGTNMILHSVSVTTWSISAILQLVLSMDYSIILMNRYRQMRENEADKETAMEQAIRRAFPSIASSGFTTIVGLLMLVFMRFQIGKDIGLVLAKGVFLSMFCCLTLLPALILLFDRQLEKSKKPTIHVPTMALAHFSYRFRIFLAAGFVLLFFGAWYVESLSEASFSLAPKDPIADIFPSDNQIVLLYGNADEENISVIAKELRDRSEVRSVSAYSTTIGEKRTAAEMTAFFEEMMEEGGGDYTQMLGSRAEEWNASDLEAAKNMLSVKNMETVYQLYAAVQGEGSADRLSMEDLFRFIIAQVSNPVLRSMMGPETAEMISQAGDLVDYAKSQLTGPEHSLMMISTSLPVEGEETSAFLADLEGALADSCEEGTYLVGNSVMSQEMKENFGRELLSITLLTAAAIFLVVLATFRRIAIPAVLVLLVQCGVFLTVSTTWLLGYRMYYLALLIVQCILMGATVDYGILFTNYYREKRKELDVRHALEASYEGAIHTILTSSLFMIFGTGAIGFSPADPTIAQICQSISIGATSATLLVIFVLPGILAALDRWICPSK